MNKFRMNIDGKEVFGLPGQTILEVARENDIFIPTLCYDERTKIYGSCGLCVRRCPIHALTLESGFDRVACQRHLAEFEKRLGADVCGKCTLQLPCTYGIPGRK